LADTELTAQPGTTWQYASANYVILGLLVEVESGVPYERYALHLLRRTALTPGGRVSPTPGV
jgi:CubicO group peptidase (beta-lactamase class C family)